MSWNHRVLIIKHEAKTDEWYYEIHECHYTQREDTLPTSWSKNAVTPLGVGTLDELKRELTMMLEACVKPVLIEHDGKLEEWIPTS